MHTMKHRHPVQMKHDSVDHQPCRSKYTQVSPQISTYSRFVSIASFLKAQLHSCAEY